MSARMTWHGDLALNFVREAAWEGIVRSTEFLHAALLQELNVSNPRPYHTPSKPGEPPRKRTGFGQKSVMREYDKEALRSRTGVGVNARYMLYLDIGTRNIQPRPWLWVMVEKLWPQLQIFAGAGGKS